MRGGEYEPYSHPGSEHPYGPPPSRGMGRFAPVGGPGRPSRDGAPPSGAHPSMGLLEPPYPLSASESGPPSGDPDPVVTGGSGRKSYNPGIAPPGPGQAAPPSGEGVGYSEHPSHVSSDVGAPGGGGGYGRSEPAMRDGYSAPLPPRAGSGSYYGGAGE